MRDFVVTHWRRALALALVAAGMVMMAVAAAFAWGPAGGFAVAGVASVVFGLVFVDVDGSNTGG